MWLTIDLITLCAIQPHPAGFSAAVKPSTSRSGCAPRVVGDQALRDLAIEGEAKPWVFIDDFVVPPVQRSLEVE